MRLRLGVVFGAGRERAAIVPVEIVELAPPEPTGPWGRFAYTVGEPEQPESHLEVLRDRLLQIATDEWPSDPCVFVDASVGPGAALVKVLHDHRDWPEGLHRPHAYLQRGQARQGLLTTILQASGNKQLEFERTAGTAGNPLVKALESYHAEVSDDGRVSARGENEALVVALGLAIAYPRHFNRQPPRYRNRDGTLAFARAVAGDPYDTSGSGNPRR